MQRRLYIWQQPEWPALSFRIEELAELLAGVRYRQGILLGRMAGLGLGSRQEAALTTLTEDVVKTSEIEGETLNADLVRSSVARRMGLDFGGVEHRDRNVDGTVDMVMDATQQYEQPLTEQRLFDWQAALFPTGRSGMRRIIVGGWRQGATDSMQVVSGPIGRERVHFEAPLSASLDREMRTFLDWFNSSQDTDPVIKAGLAHLWFVTVHPFEDGNGRIARAIADMALARADGTGQRFYSVSSQIRKERRDYYRILEQTQQGSPDVTAWLTWFLNCLGMAIDSAETTLTDVIARGSFWTTMAHVNFNERQHSMVNRLLDGFDGKLTAAKWAQISKCSHDTALRDINDLISSGVLVRSAASGRSTSYDLVTSPTNPQPRHG